MFIEGRVILSPLSSFLKSMPKKTKKIIAVVLFFFALASLFFIVGFAVDAYLENFNLDASLLNKTEISPQEPVAINFSRPIPLPKLLGKATVEPNVEIKISWEKKNTKMIITPAAFWVPGTKYKINYSGRSVFLTKAEQESFNFSTAGYPEVFNIYPRDGQKNIVLDIEDPIVVDFDKSTKNFSLKFTLDPFADAAYLNNTEKTQFKLLPKDKLQEGQHYNLLIYAKVAQDSDSGYKIIHKSFFETLPPPPATWDKDFALRLDQARKYTPAKISVGKYIDINLSQQILSAFIDGRLLDSYLISSGKRGMDTPKGTFKIANKAPRPWSKTYGLYMPNWMAIVSDGKFGIHELPEWPGGYKEGANHLGTPVSHGCVRLGVGPSKIVFDWADIGTPVVIY